VPFPGRENESVIRESVEPHFDGLQGESKETDLIINEHSPRVLLPKGVAGNRECSIDGY
jgi:hypothetical protein